MPKLRRNVERDAEQREALEALGWRTAVIWECETRNDETLFETINNAFDQ